MEKGRASLNQGKRPLGRPTRRWEDDVRTYMKERGVSMRSWIDLPQIRIFGNLRVS